MRRRRGFALMSAIFLLVVLALLGAYMVRLATVQAGSTQLGATSARVYYAARAGLEWGIHQAVGPAAGSGLCSASTPVAVAGTGLASLTVTVTCSLSTQAGGGGANHSVYYLTSTASSGTPGSPEFAERKLAAQVCRSNVATPLSC